MGCLNSTGQFPHWFSNIHLSGPCNRACYFCIGQHMMSMDSFNVLDKWPLPGIEAFCDQLNERGISEVNVTGTNTDPLLYQHLDKLHSYLVSRVPDLKYGIRTNGALWRERLADLKLFNFEVSVSMHSFDAEIYRKMMGSGSPPDIEALLPQLNAPMKVNIVLSPFILEGDDLFKTLGTLSRIGVPRVNLREPYGQPHIGNPLAAWPQTGERFGMPIYQIAGTEVMYWDVHFVEVESVNLYADGHVSTTYPITKGCVEGDGGEVSEQSNFHQTGRVRNQWLLTPPIAGRESEDSDHAQQDRIAVERRHLQECVRPICRAYPRQKSILWCS